MSGLVLTDESGGVTTLTLNRPEKRNALSIDLRRELTAAVQGASESTVVIVTGAGPAFCAGMDVTQFGGDEANRRELWESTIALFAAVATVPVPTIAAVNGPALGGGLVLAACCDIRLAAPTASFGCPEIARGIPPSYGALLRMAPEQVARELAFTGRVVHAEEALGLGLVREVHGDVLARAAGMARAMAAHGRDVLVSTKRLVGAASSGGAPDRALAAEQQMLREALFGET